MTATGAPEMLYEGRRCVVAGKPTRVRNRKVAGAGFHNVLSVRFLDDALTIVDSAAVPAAKFNRAAKPTGRRVLYIGRGYGVVAPISDAGRAAIARQP